MKEYILTANKNHTCDACRNPILKGEKYSLQKCKSPEYDDDDMQNGICYWQVRTHLDENKCYWPEDCRNGNHVMESFTPIKIQDGDIEFGYDEYCKICGASRLEITKHDIAKLGL